MQSDIGISCNNLVDYELCSQAALSTNQRIFEKPVLQFKLHPIIGPCGRPWKLLNEKIRPPLGVIMKVDRSEYSAWASSCEISREDAVHVN